MECNRDEAARAKEIAKRKFLANDISGARKFALKAQNLYRELDGISQMIATFDVHLAAHNIINGEIDWYGVLGVNPEANDETVRKQYRKLAVMLHPDKNKSVGAEEAFKHLSQAWCMFSDKAKRAEYDQKRIAGLYQKASTSGGTASANPAMNGFHKVTKSSVNTSKAKSTKRGMKRAGDAPAAASSHKPIADGTFWTVCRNCRTQYEYHRVYLNQNLLCPNCRKPFIAVETAPPGSGSIRKSFVEHQFNADMLATGRKKSVHARDNGVYCDLDSYGQANFQWSVFSGNENAAHAAQPGSRKDEGLRRKYSKRSGGVSSAAGAPKKRRGLENTGAVNATSHVHRGTGVNDIATNPNSAKGFPEHELLNLLKKKAKHEIWKKPQESNRVTEVEMASKRRRTGNDQDNAGSENSEANMVVCELGNGITESFCLDSIDGTSRINRDSKDGEAITVLVPGSDFFDFDKNRTERSFNDNQIWAAYDSFEGMPRCYAMIHDVVSSDPFKVRISWLTWETKSELSSLKWLGSGLPKTCGGFRVGKSKIHRSPYTFSHKVRWTKGIHEEIFIYPRKGDVWALYSNWSPDWICLSGCETIKYDIVEVLEGYTEDYGVSVVPLVKVAGFKAVFHHHLDPREVRRIPKEEISRFSHMIPSYLVTGREAPDAPKGCRVLDPAATPSDFLQVVVHGELEDSTPLIEECPKSCIDLEQAERKRTADETGKPIQETEEKPNDSEAMEIVFDT